MYDQNNLEQLSKEQDPARREAMQRLTTISSSLEMIEKSVQIQRIISDMRPFTIEPIPEISDMSPAEKLSESMIDDELGNQSIDEARRKVISALGSVI